MRRILLALLLVIGLAPVTAAQSLPEWSIWKNQRTSLLIITVINGKDFIGTFINNAQGYHCKGIGVPITGTVTGNDVMFVANFAPLLQHHHCVERHCEWKHDRD
jgi:hypothetical protein